MIFLYNLDQYTKFQFQKTKILFFINYFVCFHCVTLLTPKGPRLILGTNREKLPLFRAMRKKLRKKKVFSNSTIQICTRLLWECVEKISNTLTAWIERL